MKAMEILKLRGQLNALLDMAKNNTAINDGAQYIYDNLPDDLVELLFMDNWFEALTVLAPDVVPLRAWFEQVRAAALPMFDGPGDDVGASDIVGAAGGPDGAK